MMNKDNRRRTVLIAILGSISLLPLLVLPAMVGGFVDHLALSDSEAGYAASAGFLGGALAAITISLRIHRMNLRRLAVTGLMLMVIADGTSIFAADMPTWLFVLARFISGVGGASAYASVMSAYAGWREAGRAYGLFMAMQFTFSAIGLYSLPWILPETGIAGLFVLFMLLDILAFLLVAQVPDRNERKSVSSGLEIEWRVIVAPVSLMCLAGIGLFEVANMASFAYAERIGVSAGLAGKEIGIVLGMATMLGIPAGLGVYFLGSRFGQFTPIIVVTLIQCVALVLLLSGQSIAIYVISMCLLAAGWGFVLPYFQAIEARIDPGGSVVVAGGFATSFGGFIGPAAAAALVSPGDYDGMIIGALVSLLLVIILVRLVAVRMRETV